MKMKKVVPFAMTALLVGSAMGVPTASASEVEAVVNTSETNEQQAQPVFVKVTGKVENVDVRDNATYYTVVEGEQTNIVVVDKDSLVFDNMGKEVKLQKGDKVLAYSYAKKPMLAIYPPQYNPEVIIVEKDNMGSVEVDYFDKNLIDTDNYLKLNVGEDTKIESVSGKELKASDLEEQHLVVFYTIATMSIPAQTPPSKVIVLDNIEKEEPVEVDPVPTPEPTPDNGAIEEIIQKDFYEVEGTKMVPLRLIVEKLGFEVEVTPKGAIISKGAVSYTITRGQKEYGYNKAIRQFDVAPALLESGKTYVPVEFVEELMK
ncbi:copper amine oxidase N-terminal domain-containing protein [Lysinibacillus fusiformis]|uniref:Copper amine oxidase N-terminal domain-containing protein n=1 Tax=Lysinibacillus fusiformis TaxID=28031 RepID=A0A1H8ZVD2_9BACI|nr:copper amine oxidase N-terminal domain-containing protein [Lysinibacillus fusiformis]MCG7434857.1 copper amine oxidase N-terminal domain-containing protein [Lysinibacillus fusiformis]SCX67907.1 Copper amine oxidase N-terminal domain-containing protein [Lysinibacillus fusiformis]SCX88234.1 Copper amine oxidase N-terminal domain-containing protein [Lysinibacillus fusiformis]SDB54804.1 Copper amine oxidase N-terminal domain-containing protein [Lysinibacillus fusiformis]SEM85151.1 Copper amine 